MAFDMLLPSEPNSFTSSSSRPTRTVRVGFIQLADAAPIILAAEAGLFAAVGLNVILSRELGWSSIQDRLFLGELDYIHALAPMPLAASQGVGCSPTDSIGLMALSHNGDGITLTRKWWNEGIRTAEAFAAFIRQEKWRRRFTFGVVSAVSCHHFLLRKWLAELDLRPGRDVEIVNLPPGQFLRNLQADTIDGACIGEPWNSYAVHQGIGWCISNSMRIQPDHPEKTIMTTRENLEADPDAAARLVGALWAASEWCERADFIPKLARLLARAPYLQMPSKIIATSLKPDSPTVEETGTVTGIHFGRGKSPQFSLEALDWLHAGLRESGILKTPIGGGRHALTRYYPSSVVKNAHPYAEIARRHAFSRFFSEG